MTDAEVQQNAVRYLADSNAVLTFERVDLDDGVGMTTEITVRANGHRATCCFPDSMSYDFQEALGDVAAYLRDLTEEVEV